MHVVNMRWRSLWICERLRKPAAIPSTPARAGDCLGPQYGYPW